MLLGALVLLCLSCPYVTRALNMNEGGVPYAISNPPGSTKGWKGTAGAYSTNFEENVAGDVDHFDVYGEVHTQYSQVYWTRNTPIDLPAELVERFKGKVMAITGYEVDQVTHKGPQTGTTTKGDVLGGFSCYPSCDAEDQSVPIYNAYNHHYFGWLTGKDSEMYELEKAIKLPNPTTTAFRKKPGTAHQYPTSIVFKENPGGEYRKSYHGYPSGFAQLLHSPTQWVVEPMQIDTHNRKYGINEEAGYRPWFLPQQDNNSMTDLRVKLSPLIECPCSDRIARKEDKSNKILVEGTCASPVATSEADCRAAVEGAGVVVSSASTVSDLSRPAGCSMHAILEPSGGAEATAVPTYAAVLNTAAKSVVTCGPKRGEWKGSHNATHGPTDQTWAKAVAPLPLRGDVTLGELTNLTIEHDGTTATITLSGPADGSWFGVALDAEAMKDLPYALIVGGSGGLTERRLGEHSPGKVLAPSAAVISNTVIEGMRTVVITRPVAGASADHYTFPTVPGDINVITAVGNSAIFAYHKERTGGKVTLVPSDPGASACVCQPKKTGTLVYMNTTSFGFDGYDCLDEPRSDMLRYGDGTGQPVANAACSMRTYMGGLQCCKHKFFLTDRAQDDLVKKSRTDSYFLKWRYYFQEYVPAVPAVPAGGFSLALLSATPASHRHIHHWVFLIDASVNDYEEDNKPGMYGTPSVGKITAHLTVRTMGLEDLAGGSSDGGAATPVPDDFQTVTSVVITPHCHAPSCIREELWNADTGEIICNVTAMYGHGNGSKVFNEANYVSIPPCLFNYDQPGLQRPFTLTPDTNITAIKYFNNTYRHLGQMAQWTGLMVYDNDPY